MKIRTRLVRSADRQDGLIRVVSTVLGDAVPHHLSAYYTALDGGQFDLAADAFTTDCLYAVPPAGIETQPRLETLGRSALLTRFQNRGALARAHVVTLCVVDGTRCLVEGVVADSASGEFTSTFVASATFGEGGRIARYIGFGCDEPRDPIPTDIDAEPAAVGDVLDAYFGALDDGRFEEAAGCFSDDVLYSHPPYRHTGIDGDRRVEFRNKEQLLEAFRARGRQSFGHRIIACIQRGPHALLEGAVHDLPDNGSGSFISSLTLDDRGRIRRYVSFYCEPAVAQG